MYGFGGLQNYNIRVLEVEKFEATRALHDECQKFTGRVGELAEVVGKIAKRVEGEAQKIEREKLKAVGMRNRLATEAEQARTAELEQRGLLAEKQEELERLTLEHESLARVRNEQEPLIARLIHAGSASD